MLVDEGGRLIAGEGWWLQSPVAAHARSVCPQFLGRLRTTQKPPVRLDPSLVLRMGVKSGEGGKLNKDERECSNYCKYGN